MVGLIWFVQIVHYPLMGRVGKEVFQTYADAHSRLTSFVVGPPMLLEAATTVLLVPLHPANVALWQILLGIALLAVAWLSTYFLQVPCHRVLGGGFDPTTHRFLVRSNWLRTAAWSARGILLLYLVAGTAGLN